jgi:hypothetical protein
MDSFGWRFVNILITRKCRSSFPYYHLRMFASKEFWLGLVLIFDFLCGILSHYSAVKSPCEMKPQRKESRSSQRTREQTEIRPLTS